MRKKNNPYGTTRGVVGLVAGSVVSYGIGGSVIQSVAPNATKGALQSVVGIAPVIMGTKLLSSEARKFGWTRKKMKRI